MKYKYLIILILLSSCGANKTNNHLSTLSQIEIKYHNKAMQAAKEDNYPAFLFWDRQSVRVGDEQESIIDSLNLEQ